MALLIATAFPVLSQEDTVKLPFSVAKQVALDLEELDRLRAVDKVNTLELAKYQELVKGLEQNVQDRTTQASLLERSIQLWKTQYESEKAKKPEDNTLAWILRCLSAAAVGFVIGVVVY